ncbi:hypothetical protein [Ferribacterium limneticum]|uniref:hypothetical protein n=1 Tax=Ferribacterium limneticum TaxID=76259 RepID=UPI001CF8BC1E|nr:hypothetical protein [Ferribacterium limneticum]UCV23595.1 hypothetical protein KI613_03380 [Ferribacterium limneticum]
MNVILFPAPASPAITLSESLDAVVVKRGRRPGVKTVSPETNQRRRQWLLAVMESPCANAELCRQLEAPDSFVSHLLSGRRTFTNALARRIEAVLGLTSGAIDAAMFPRPIAHRCDDDPKPERVLDDSIEKALLGMLNTAIHQGRVGNLEALQLLTLIIAM